jgi:peroxiredoxin
MTDGPAPGVGDRAPSFRLRKTFEQKVSLEDLLEGRRPLLLAFYVFDFGSV